MKKNNYLLFVFSVLLVVILSLLTESCADDPSSLGLKFLPPGETTGVKIFDSFTDTMVITPTNIKKRVNTSSSGNFLVGTSGSYISKALLKFNNLSTSYDSAVVNSATLTMKYRNYYFPNTSADSLGQTGFDIFKVQQDLNLTTITLDSVNSSSFGTTSQGNYTGFLTADSQEINISLNTDMVKDWLYSAANASWPNKNYGVAFIPNAGSTALKAFYSTQTISGLKPLLQIIVTKNNRTDTLYTEDAQSVSLVDGTPVPGSESFSIQSGIGYIEVLKFDMSHIPNTATINDAQLFLTLDTAHSIFSSQTLYSIYSAYISDTASGIVTSGRPYESSISGSQYITRLAEYRYGQASPFQIWLDGQANYGIELYTKSFSSNLDLFSFFNVNASDPSKRPRVIIKYTPRVTP